MSFIMPRINIDSVNDEYKNNIKNIIDQNGFLEVIPNSQTNDLEKLIHVNILRKLYRDTRFKTPHNTAWRLPHVVTVDPLEQQLAKTIVDGLVFFK